MTCNSARHVGPRDLPPEAFCRDLSKPNGLNPTCRACCSVMRKEARARKPDESPTRTKRMCAEEGCLDRPANRGTKFCAYHRRRSEDGRKFRPKRNNAKPETWHDLAVRIMAKGW